MKNRLTVEQQWMLFNNSALSRRLPEDHYREMEGLMHVFWHEVKFKSHGVGEITEEIRVLVAAEACMLIILLGYEPYRYLKKVEIHRDDITMMEGQKAAGTAGRNIVQLAWSPSLEGSQYGSDNYNVILHEFAHVIDQAPYGIADSIPMGVNSVDCEEWKEVLDREYTKLQEAYQSGGGHTLDEYSISCDSKAEFFTCATEAFFELAAQLQASNPEIYRLLSNFYGLDPAQWDRTLCPGCHEPTLTINKPSCRSCGWPGENILKPQETLNEQHESNNEAVFNETNCTELFEEQIEPSPQLPHVLLWFVVLCLVFVFLFWRMFN